MSEELNMTPKQTLAFFASVIKSGEPWTGTCQKAYDEAMAALASPMTALTPAAEEEGESCPLCGAPANSPKVRTP